jgi:hypothetical protein
MDVAQRAARAQVALAVAEQVRARASEWQAVADRGDGVLQHPLAAGGHVHVAAGHRHEVEMGGQGQQAFEACVVVLLAMQFDREVRALAEHLPQPGALAFVGDDAGKPQREQAGGATGVECMRFDIGTRQAVAALGRRAARGGDQPAQLCVAGGVLHQQHQSQAVVEAEFGADDQLHAGDPRRLVRAHDARQRAFVGDRQRFVAAVGGTREQFLGTGGAAEEGEVGQAVEFGVGRSGGLHRAAPAGEELVLAVLSGGPRHRGEGIVGRAPTPARPLQFQLHLPLHAQDPRLARTRRIGGHAGGQAMVVVVAHANHPCSIQSPCTPGGAKAQARCPREVSST